MVQAYIFPGQGSQFVGMGAEAHDRYPSVQQRFGQARDILGFEIQKVMFEGPVEKLQQTSIAQPAIYIYSVALAEALNIGVNAKMVAGHSLGAYSALAATGVLSFEEGLRLVNVRAHAMKRACERRKGAMAAIIGPSHSEVEHTCRGLPEVWLANYNCPGQVVISGCADSVDSAISLLQKQGARLAKRLAVEGAFHSPYMDEAIPALEEAVLASRFRKPSYSFYPDNGSP